MSNWRKMKPRNRAAERWELWTRRRGERWKYQASGTLRECLDESDKHSGYECNLREVTDQPAAPDLTPNGG